MIQSHTYRIRVFYFENGIQARLSAMALFGKLFSGGEKVRKTPCQQEEIEKLPEREEMLMKKREFLKKKIDDELLFAKTNSRKNRRGALQALRRKKWYEKHLKYIDCAVKSMRDVVNKMNDLIKDITEEHDLTQDMSDSLHTCVGFGVEFDEDELLTELERLENNLDESLFEADVTEDRVPCPKLSSTASAPQPANTEEDEIEDGLEYLRRWAIEPSQTHQHP
ncbi:charged multivesicular body protein 4b-like isoform X2 [Centropristis striata]|uniref:charged multivesicular body protein 4b-like isoform X2 n=1 Tax=Centropristis striata TaxID=184440 RepID=UPI0027E08501|nr:charged multivesicular body protein 4b-like isoform X2 [Centropristis striata]